MSRIKPKALSPTLARHWAGLGHLFFLDALATTTPLAVKDIAFHGGTNLHLSWGSPRWSEDLDFLASEDFASRIRALMPRIERRMQALALRADPDLQVEIRDRTRPDSRLLDFRAVLRSPRVVGQVMVKAEFWMVDGDYLRGFDTEVLVPSGGHDLGFELTQELPVATLRAAMADKVVAMAFRPHLKWRDMFDLWWISRQARIGTRDIRDEIRHHASTYRPDTVPGIEAGLRRFLEHDRDALIAAADPDLRKWLPPVLWQSLWPEGVGRIVDHARAEAATLLDHLPEEPGGGGGPGGTGSEDPQP